MVSTEARAKTAPRIHNRYGLVFIPDTDVNDNGFPAFSIDKFAQKQLFVRLPESLVNAAFTRGIRDRSHYALTMSQPATWFYRRRCRQYRHSPGGSLMPFC
jgi:hypothetical protein